MATASQLNGVNSSTMDSPGSAELPASHGTVQPSGENDEVFADGEYIWYVRKPNQPIRGRVEGFDGTAYDINLDNGNEMTVPGRFLRKGKDTPSASDGLDDAGNSNDDFSKVNNIPPTVETAPYLETGRRKKEFQSSKKGDSSDLDSDTETEVEEDFQTGDKLWYAFESSAPELVIFSRYEDNGFAMVRKSTGSNCHKVPVIELKTAPPRELETALTYKDASQDSETKTDDDDVPVYGKGEWIWYTYKHSQPVRGRVTQDCFKGQEVVFDIHPSGASQTSRMTWISHGLPPPQDNGTEATSNAQKAPKPLKVVIRKSTRTKEPKGHDKAATGIAAKPKSQAKMPKQPKHGGKKATTKEYEHKGTKFSYPQMALSFCNRPTNSIIKEPKYYETLKFVAHAGLEDLTKATTRDILFCYCSKCDQIVEYRAGYYKGIQRHYFENHATNKEMHEYFAKKNGETPKVEATIDKKSELDGKKKRKGGTTSKNEANVKALADERKKRMDLEKKLKALTDKELQVKKALEEEKKRSEKALAEKAKVEEALKAASEANADNASTSSRSTKVKKRKKRKRRSKKRRSRSHSTTSSSSSSSTSESSSSSSYHRSSKKHKKHKRKSRSRSKSRDRRSLSRSKTDRDGRSPKQGQQDYPQQGQQYYRSPQYQQAPQQYPGYGGYYGGGHRQFDGGNNPHNHPNYRPY